MKIHLPLLLSLLVSLLLTSTLYAQRPPSVAVVDAVNDYAGVLSPEAHDRIDQMLRQHHQNTGVQLAVVIVTSTHGVPIEDYSLAIAEAWGGGSAERDDGMLFLLATEDRRTRIEIGYGLEAIVTDARAALILDEAAPALGARDFDSGVEIVAHSLIKATTMGATSKFVASFFPDHQSKNTFFSLLAIFFTLFASSLLIGAGLDKPFASDPPNKKAIFISLLFGLALPVLFLLIFFYVNHYPYPLLCSAIWIGAFFLGRKLGLKFWKPIAIICSLIGGLIYVLGLMSHVVYFEYFYAVISVPLLLLLHFSIFTFQDELQAMNGGGRDGSDGGGGGGSFGGGSFSGGGGSFGGGGASGSF